MTANAKVPAGAIPRRAAILAQHRDFPAFKALQSGQIWQFPRYSRLIWEYPAVEVLIRVPIKPESRLIKPNQGKSNQMALFLESDRMNPSGTSATEPNYGKLDDRHIG